MKELTVIACYWVHLVAAAIWIGGIFFTLYIAIPSSRQAVGQESGRLMAEISRRFTPFANYSIMLLVITGVVLVGLSKQQFTATGILEGNSTRALILKLILVLTMGLIHFYRGLILSPKIKRTTPDAEKSRLQKLSLNLVKVNLALGLSVLLLSGAMSVFRGL